MMDGACFDCSLLFFGKNGNIADGDKKDGGDDKVGQFVDNGAGEKKYKQDGKRRFFVLSDEKEGMVNLSCKFCAQEKKENREKDKKRGLEEHKFYCFSSLASVLAIDAKEGERRAIPPKIAKRGPQFLAFANFSRNFLDIMCSNNF